MSQQTALRIDIQAIFYTSLLFTVAVSTFERLEAEARARHAEYHLVAPLRAMREYDYLTGAIRDEMARQIRGTG